MSEAQGLSLADIGDLGEMVDVGRSDGQKLRVTGISAKGCLILLIRYPDLEKWLTGQSIAIGDIVVQAPDAVAAIIAAGTGAPGDSDAEEVASALPVDRQIDIVEAVYRQTFKEGFGPFVERVLRLYDAAVKSGNYGKGADTKSPPESKPLSQPDTAPSTSGTTPLAA